MSAPTGRRRVRRCPAGPTRRPAARSRRPVDPDPLLPWPPAPGRGGPRRGPARARRGPVARAPRRDRHVPGHRDVRAADPGELRRRTRARPAGTRPSSCRPELRPVDLRVRLADRSLRQTNAVLGVVSRAAGAGRGPADRLRGARPGRSRARPPALSLRRRRPRPAAGLDRPGRDPLGARRRASRALQARAGRQRDLAVRPRPAAAGGDDDRGRAAPVRRRASARRRRQPLDRPRRTAGRADRPARRGGRRAQPAADAGRMGRSRSPTRRTRSPTPARSSAGSAPSCSGCSTTWSRGRRARPTAPGAAELAPAEVRAYIAERLQGRPTRANFRTGHLTVCTLMPMRSVPHRVVCLLGLDDGAFPRKAPRDGDDLMLDDPHVGERDPRSEDRQLLLDALLAATERLIVTYTGNDERTNSPRPAAVPVGELLDVVDATVRVDGGLRPRPRGDPPSAAAVRPAQLLQPGAWCPDRRWSFDPVTLEGARALDGPRAAGAAVPERAAAGAGRAGDRARGPGPVRRAPGAGVPAPAARASRCGADPTRSRTRSRSSSPGWGAGASGSGCSRRDWPGSTARTRSGPRSPAARCRRGCSASR